MVSARLSIGFREYGMSLAEFDVSLSSKFIELPLNEGTVERVCVSGNERSPPVSIDAELLEISLALRREELRPVVGILELRDLFIWNAKRL
jgi:hypothetical protein